MKPYKRFFIQLLLGLALGSVLQLIFPFLTQAIVDKGIATKNLNLDLSDLGGTINAGREPCLGGLYPSLDITTYKR